MLESSNMVKLEKHRIFQESPGWPAGWMWANHLTLLWLFFFLRFYLYIHQGHTERGRDTGRGRSRFHAGSLVEDLVLGLRPALGSKLTGESASPFLPAPPPTHVLSLSQIFYFLFFKKDFIYLFMRNTEREREREAEGEAGSMQGAWCGTRSRDSRITPWAKGSAKPLSHPGIPILQFFYLWFSWA